MHTSPFLNASLGLCMDKTGIHFYSDVVHPGTNKLVYPQSTTRSATFSLAQKALLPSLQETPGVCPGFCATDTADGDTTTAQTDSPSALSDLTTHGLRAP